ncbi:MAG: 16S rRNA (adenine(1518)-N(6)/adenine(1519)-N(6))-dimethyltransferase RsmA [Clostridia bacterium]|nr:16S rRNA (adenine(1518)-N(6)/adenine(1519)-N(6))-dimethyltransferase RsmA [Clostridia bacterium]
MYRDEVKKIMSNNEILPEQKFGQNFLCDENIIEDIIDCSGITEDSCVLEIGPGIGALTHRIQEITTDYTAVEIDKRLADFLRREIIISDDVKIIDSDFLDLNYEQYKRSRPYDYIVSNIPYYVMTPIMKKLITDNPSCKRMTFMVENAAVNRIIAKEGNKNYGPLAVLCSNYGDVKKEFDVFADSFIPRPHTLSSVITVTGNVNRSDSFVNRTDLYLQFLDAAFSLRRKTMMNCLSNFLKTHNASTPVFIGDLATVLDDMNIPLNVRTEALTPEQIHSIFLKLLV